MRGNVVSLRKGHGIMGLHCFCMESIDLSFLCRKAEKELKMNAPDLTFEKGRSSPLVGLSLVGVVIDGNRKTCLYCFVKHFVFEKWKIVLFILGNSEKKVCVKIF